MSASFWLDEKSTPHRSASRPILRAETGQSQSVRARARETDSSHVLFAKVDMLMRKQRQQER